MAVSFAGLDLDFMRKNPLPKRERKPAGPDFSQHRAEGIAIPAFLSDIKPFVANATRETVEITSRSKLRAYERANNIRQCGDFKPGEIVSEQRKRMEKATYLPPEEKKAADFKWVD
jgi:hypothetical protein